MSVTLVTVSTDASHKFGKRLAALRTQRGLTQGQLARMAGVDPSYISQLEGDLRKGDMSVDVAGKLAAALQVSVNELVGRTVIHDSPATYSTTEIPIRGYVAAGTPKEVYETDMGNVSVPSFVLDKHPQAFALVISGDSLKDDSIQDGDLVVVDPDAGLTIGKLYVIRLGSEFCARHLFIEEDHVRLKAANSHYEDIKLSELDIVGRVVWHMRTRSRTGCICGCGTYGREL